jgi:hypothetical protein
MGWDRTGYADSPGDLLSTGHEKAGPRYAGVRLSNLRLDDLRLQIELVDLRFTIDEH